MKQLITARHYIRIESSFLKFKKKLEELGQAEDFKKILKDEGAWLCLNVSYSSKNEELYTAISESVRNLSKEGFEGINIVYSITPDVSQNNSVESGLLGKSFKNQLKLACLFDFDQFLVNSSEAVEAIKSLMDRTAKDNYLMAVGSRDVKVRLGIHKNADEIKQIQELLHSSYIQSDFDRKYSCKPRGVSDAYHFLGDSTPGFYLFNFNHSNSKKLIQSSDKQAQAGNLGKSAREYHLVLKTKEFGKIITDYVKSEENPFYANQFPDDEKREAESFVSRLTNRLGKAELLGYKEFIKSNEPIDVLSGYFDRGLVKHTVDIMRKAQE